MEGGEQSKIESKIKEMRWNEAELAGSNLRKQVKEMGH